MNARSSSSLSSSSSATRARWRSALSCVIVLGILIALWPVGQHVYGWWSQRQLMAEWRNTPAVALANKTEKPNAKTAREKNPVGNAARNRGAAGAVTIASAQPMAAAPAAWPKTRIIAPEIELDAAVVQGIAEKDLARGPGHYPRTALPGQPGNCVIAGHRNVSGSWFYQMESLMPGSIVRLQTRNEVFDYQVLEVHQVSETDSRVLRSDPNGPAFLTLITCTLPHSSNRIIVSAQLIS